MTECVRCGEFVERDPILLRVIEHDCIDESEHQELLAQEREADNDRRFDEKVALGYFV